ncbi:amidase family protein [Xylariomycetidae sp. FL2044]|nr:amidase family protein [Xylariomycetidae sp. FL2044]
MDLTPTSTSGQLLFKVLTTLLLWSTCPLSISSADAAPTKRASYQQTQTTQHGGVAFNLGNNSYFANIQYPRGVLGGDCSTAASSADTLVPFTVIYAPAAAAAADDDAVVTGEYLADVVTEYLEGDDVFSEDFLEGVFIAWNGTGGGGKATLDQSAVDYLNGLEVAYLFVDSAFDDGDWKSDIPVTHVSSSDGPALPAGPYAASVSAGSVALSMVYRLYRDSHRDFLYGAYASNDGAGTFYPLEVSNARFWDPMIPVPSRVYSRADPRPLAGYRVAIKDLFDMKGLVTSGGSQAWAETVAAANSTAPSIQRILDLGAVLVGKYKLAQFASGADPWEWQDEHYPFNPRGDGWLTCSASSSGGGCSVAAYDWLDFAIGSDTGSSMRRPAAVYVPSLLSGTFGNRPSQGLMTLEQVMPLGAATDTAGVFSRTVAGWVHFAKNWYVPEMCQDPSITGLSPLVAPDSYAFPKRILYLTDYLPLANPAAEAVLQGFIANMSAVFGMTVEHMNLTAVVGNAAPDVPKYADLSNATSILNTMTQYAEVAAPLMRAWAQRYDGRFPPVDPARRPGWRAYNASYYTQALYAEALATKRRGVDWFEAEVLRATPDSCSESVMLWDIGTGGLPSYREREMVEAGLPDRAAFLAVTPERAGLSGASLCPVYGCVDMTIPIGQVAYRSNVTFVEEMMPVTVSVIARRGCDFMLWNMWEEMARRGALRDVAVGRTAF